MQVSDDSVDKNADIKDGDNGTNPNTLKIG